MNIQTYLVVSLFLLGGCETGLVSGSAEQVEYRPPLEEEPLPPDTPGPACVSVVAHAMFVAEGTADTHTLTLNGVPQDFELNADDVTGKALLEICLRQQWTEEAKRCVMKNTVAGTNLLQQLTAFRDECGLADE